MALYDANLGVLHSGRHLEPKPGDRLPLHGVDAIVAASGGAVLTKPLRGGGAGGDGCSAGAVATQEPVENPRSTGVMLTFGTFRFLDVGDLRGPALHSLTGPINLLGQASAYLVAHHGGTDVGGGAMYSSVRPLVTLINNGPAKGGAPETFETLAAFKFIDAWQLHLSANRAVVNMPDARVANLAMSTNACIKLTATADAAFLVTNGRTGESKSYHRE